MFFLYENILYLLLVPLLFFLFSLKQGKSSMRKIFSKTVLEQLVVNGSGLQSPVRYRLFLLAFSFFILSLARPVTDEKVISGRQALIPVVIALDVSGSMHLDDIYPDRLTLAREKLKKLISKSVDMSIGIILFDKSAYMAYPLSDDTAALAYMLDHLSRQQKFEANSNIFAALEAGSHLLRNQAAKNIIMLSDGGNSDDVTQEIQYLKEQHIALYAIGIATEKGAHVSGETSPLSKLNPTLEELALQSGGSYQDFSWSDNDISVLLAEIKKKAQNEKENAYQSKQYTELFSYPLALGVLLLFFAFSSGLKMRKEPLALLLFTLLSVLTPETKLQAGILDFMALKEAENLYDEQKYAQAAALYRRVAKNCEGYYNLANALYKAQQYEEAVSMYRKCISDEASMKAKILHNIGNCYVQMNALKLAKKYYEEALKSDRNTLTEENLARVNKALLEAQRVHKEKKPKKERGCKRIGVEEIEPETPPSSTYAIPAEDLVLSEEKRWMKLLQKEQAPIFLQKLETKRMSHHAAQPW